MAEEKLIIDFWDVGQGDATVIRLPDDKLIMIDVGPRGSPVIDWLKFKPRSIHAVIITHNDGDHAGALPSLVKLPCVENSTVYMLVDRDKESAQFQTIWRAAREEEKNQRLKVKGLAQDAIPWQSGEYTLKVVYPSFSENVEARQPNQTSAIVCLFYKGEIKIIWPGDAPMGAVAAKCSNTHPHLLHGPHHGGPVDRNNPDFETMVGGLVPARVFISVGTYNSHGHPSVDYLNLQAARGCHITCTQLTPRCACWPQRDTLIQTAGLLGLRPPRKGIPCRGCLRLTINGNIIRPDKWDAQHLRRLKSFTVAPSCLGPSIQ